MSQDTIMDNCEPATIEQSFTIPGKPVPFTRMVRGSARFNRQASRYSAYKDLVGHLANQAGVECIEAGPVILAVTVYLPDRMKRRWDMDNVGKGVADALNEIAYADDKQVTRAVYEVRSAGDGEIRTDVWIGRAT